MGIEEKLKTTVLSYLPQLKDTPSGWKKHNCPMCIHRGHRADTRERFGLRIEHNSFGMHCFNCGYSTRWEEGMELSDNLKAFFHAVGVPENDIDALAFECFVERHNIEHTPKALRGNIQSKWVEANLPKETRSILDWLKDDCDDENFLQVAEYAVSRRLPDLSRVAWSPDTNHLIRKRLLVPFYHRDKVVGFSGRMASNKTEKRSRYYQEIPPSYIFNLDRQYDYNRKYSIIVEGVFDALITDGIAVLHDNLNEDQIQLINNLHTIPVLCPDRDKDGDTLVNIAAKNRWYVSFPQWDSDVKDVAQAAERYGVIYAVESILSRMTNDPDKVRIWRDIDRSKYAD